MNTVASLLQQNTSTLKADEDNGLFDYGVDESTGYLLMVNYAWEKAGLTFRYSVQEDERHWWFG